MNNSILICCLLALQCALLSAQNDIDLTALPEVSEYTVLRSNPGADTVLITLHGGPEKMLFEGEFWFFEGFPTYSVVDMKQYTHLYPAVLDNTLLTREEGIQINDTTVAMLKKAVNHYNDLGKTVVLIGHSLGGFLLLEYLDDYGIDDVYKVVVMAARLNMNQALIDAFNRGFNAYFQEGVTLVIEPDPSPPDYLPDLKIAAGVAYNRFVDSLGGMDLTKLMFVYGTLDGTTGSLQQEEVGLLEDRNATILAIQEGGHGSPFDIPNLQQVLGFIREGLTVGTLEKERVEAAVKMYPTIVESSFGLEVDKRGELAIYTSLGQLVFRSTVPPGKHDIHLPGLPAGQYVVTFQTFDNEWAGRKLLVTGVP